MVGPTNQWTPKKPEYRIDHSSIALNGVFLGIRSPESDPNNIHDLDGNIHDYPGLVWDPYKPLKWSSWWWLVTIIIY